MGNQGGLNFLRLDSKTAKLDQLIEAAVEGQGAVGVPARQVA